MTARARWRRAGRRLVHVLRLVGWGAPGRGSIRERAAIATDERYRFRMDHFLRQTDDLEAGRCGRQEFAQAMAKIEEDAHEAVANARNRERRFRRDLQALNVKYVDVLRQLAASKQECIDAKNATELLLHTARQQLHVHYAAVEQQNLRLKADRSRRGAAHRDKAGARAIAQRPRRACAWLRPKPPARAGARHAGGVPLRAAAGQHLGGRGAADCRSAGARVESRRAGVVIGVRELPEGGCAPRARLSGAPVRRGRR